MTSLRQRMVEDMQIRNLSPQTCANYVYQVARFARHFNKSPEALGPEDIRFYQLFLIQQRHTAVSLLVAATSRSPGLPPSSGARTQG